MTGAVACAANGLIGTGMKAIIFSWLTIVYSATLAFAAPKVGEPAPDFSLPDTFGGTQSLEDFKGRYVVLEWVNHDCPFVKKHYNAGNMQRLQKEYTAKGVVWLSICSSALGKQGNLSPEEWNQVTTEMGANPTAVLLDPDGEVGHAYHATATPDMFVINPEGEIVYMGAIDSIASTDPADIAVATNYVKAALDAAMAGDPVATPETKPYGCGIKYP